MHRSDKVIMSPRALNNNIIIVFCVTAFKYSLVCRDGNNDIIILLCSIFVMLMHGQSLVP